MILFTPLLASVLLHCYANGALPDRQCTPGAVATTDLRVICQTSTESRRHVTEATKRAVLAEYGVAWEDRRTVEIDHLVPLALGGSNSRENLWPQPIEDAEQKDRVENKVHRDVCAGRVSVEAAQRRFMEDWRRP
jgi:hypothetical protein